MSDAFSIATLIFGAVGVYFILRAMRGFDPRRGEDEARAFYDEHGHWPDQTLEEAEAERRLVVSAFPVAEPDEHGNV
ncbi:MAG: hypothetical protein QOH62_2730 [Solirubrobacteraceae bacterium]|nr:hypothetical protein [Solirubrobacteraceae bacterium]